MKLQKFLLACLIILSAFDYTFSQNEVEAVRVDEFSPVPYDQLRSRLDNLLQEIIKNPNSKASVVI